MRPPTQRWPKGSERLTAILVGRFNMSAPEAPDLLCSRGCLRKMGEDTPNEGTWSWNLVDTHIYCESSIGWLYELVL
jgi:hypothetical protein